MDKTELTYEVLKDWQRQRRELPGFSQAVALRTHRALSWLQRAEKEADDHDAAFIFLWIAFNAAYADRISEESGFTEMLRQRRFLKRVLTLDSEEHIHDLIWKQFPGSIRLLINNQFVCREFWHYQNEKLSLEQFQEAFSRSKQHANRGFSQGDLVRVLSVLFDRLYVLRNQIVHGGATWNSGVNRDQVRDAAAFMRLFVPLVIGLMLEGGFDEWEEGIYPVVEHS